MDECDFQIEKINSENDPQDSNIITKDYFEMFEKQLESITFDDFQNETTVNIFIPQKKIFIENYLIPFSMNIQRLKEFVFSFCEKRNDPIIFFNDKEVILHLIEGLKGRQLMEKLSNETGIERIRMECKSMNEMLLTFEDKLFLNKLIFNKKCMITIFGNIKFRSDQPIACINYDFKEIIIIDYYRCNDCNLNCITFNRNPLFNLNRDLS